MPRPASLPPLASVEPGRFLERHLPVGIGRVPGFERRVAFRELRGHFGDRRIVLVEARENAGGDEPVQRLLGALVGIVDQIGKRRKHRIEQLGIERDHHLFVDQRRVVGFPQALEGHLAPVFVLERDEPRLGQVHPAGEQRQRPQFAVAHVVRRRP